MAETDDDETLLFGEDCLIDGPSRVQVRQQVRHLLLLLPPRWTLISRFHSTTHNYLFSFRYRFYFSSFGFGFHRAQLSLPTRFFFWLLGRCLLHTSLTLQNFQSTLPLGWDINPTPPKNKSWMDKNSTPSLFFLFPLVTWDDSPFRPTSLSTASPTTHHHATHHHTKHHHRMIPRKEIVDPKLLLWNSCSRSVYVLWNNYFIIEKISFQTSFFEK